jgi:hypothetical protein
MMVNSERFVLAEPEKLNVAGNTRFRYTAEEMAQRWMPRLAGRVSGFYLPESK